MEGANKLRLAASDAARKRWRWFRRVLGILAPVVPRKNKKQGGRRGAEVDGKARIPKPLWKEDEEKGDLKKVAPAGTNYDSGSPNTEEISDQDIESDDEV